MKVITFNFLTGFKTLSLALVSLKKNLGGSIEKGTFVCVCVIKLIQIIKNPNTHFMLIIKVI